MSKMSVEQTRQRKIIIKQVKALIETINAILSDNSVNVVGRYASFKTMAESYNEIVRQAGPVLPTSSRVKVFTINPNVDQFNTVWPEQKLALEEVLLSSKLLLANLEGDDDFVDDEFENFANFVSARFRSAVFEQPKNEKEVQNTFETLLIGRGMNKGTDFDRESGKIEYSSKEYIPDFVINTPKMAVEIKLIKDAKEQSRIIEQISADITAYSKEYERIMFLVYDLGCIQNEIQFRSDIEKSGNIRVIVVKH